MDNPLNLVAWALCAFVAVVVVAFAFALAVGMIRVAFKMPVNEKKPHLVKSGEAGGEN